MNSKGIKQRICPLDGKPCEKDCPDRYKDEPAGGCFLTTARELMDEGRKICKHPIAISPQALGYSLRNLDGNLMDYDGIAHDRGKNGNAPGKHYFYFRSWTDQADLQEEIAL